MNPQQPDQHIADKPTRHAPPGRSMFRSTLAWMAAATMAVCQGAVAGAFVPNESLVTTQPDMIDLEFSHSRAQFVWYDSTGRLWIGNIDRNTGMFVPVDGKAKLVDPRALTTLESLAVPVNGPEWIATENGDQIVYTKFLPVGAHTPANARIAFAQEKADGSWSTRFLSVNLPRNAPYTSSDAGDTRPRIAYVDNFGNHYWREIYDPTTEEMIPQSLPGQRSVRFVRGARALIYSVPVNGVRQIVRYDIDSKVLEQLTFDAGDKDAGSVPWMWQAPEFNNEFIFFTVVNDSELRVYRNLAPAGSAQSQWTPIYSAPFGPRTSIKSPEPFVFQGKSYIYFVTATAPATYASTVWLSNIDATAPLVRRLTEDTPAQRQRSDPEIFFTSEGTYLYYNRSDRSVIPPKQEGVYRTNTGLPVTAP